ncbi:uncharacterized protein F4807DRAFT_47780 [Annulohypoxylon truncatum]|uniref:uncharacterized protein n=1 Tax=Annulohypoxylon truncatum TaxID=327061 RepID=UPI0020089949|nr:uncharacterized protein F4807DRAFT_47780 [Annulohypoxylon truncatum]KAI1211030.1 hypothetical protein F4807DRAFT_47780 [Annulohypoxylon truncatum]
MTMSKRTTFTTISPLPPGITREVVISFLHSHVEMIDLNPLVIERHPISPPPHAAPEERRCVWWSLTDKISYLPGGVVSGDITYTAAFNDLPNGVQTHIYAPMSTDIRERWSLNGTLPGEPPEPVELGIGAPRQGLYLREDVDLRCNFVMSSFVKKTLKKAHGTLVEKLLEKAAASAPAKPLPQVPVASHQHTGSSAHSGSGSGSARSNRSSAGHAYPPAPYQRHSHSHSRQGSNSHGQGHVSPPPPGRSSPYDRRSGSGSGVGSVTNPAAPLSVDVGAANGSFMPEPLRVNRSRAPYHSGLEVVAPLQQQQRQTLNGGWSAEKPRFGQQQVPRPGDGGGFRAELE